jgi:hypothetical protein
MKAFPWIILVFFLTIVGVGVYKGPLVATNKFHDGEMVTIRINGERGQIVYSYAGSYNVRLPSLQIENFDEIELEEAKS